MSNMQHFEQIKKIKNEYFWVKLYKITDKKA